MPTSFSIIPDSALIKIFINNIMITWNNHFESKIMTMKIMTMVSTSTIMNDNFILLSEHINLCSTYIVEILIFPNNGFSLQNCPKLKFFDAKDK